MNKEEFKVKANRTIDEVSAKINELKEKKELVEQGSKSKYEENLKTLKMKKTDLEAKYSELKNASDDKWEEVKNAFSSASDSYEEGLSKITSLLK